MTLEGLYYSEISSNIGRTVLERNFDVTKHVKHEVQIKIWVPTQHLL